MPEEKVIPAADEGADKGTNAGEGQEKSTDIKPNANEIKPGEGDAGGENKEGEGAEGAGRQDDKGQEGQKESAKAPQEGSPKEGEDDNLEPETRNKLSTQDFIIGRQKAKLAKKAKTEEGEGEGGKEGEGEEVAQEDKDLITKVVSPLLAPLVEKSLKAEDDKEVKDFLEKNPDFKPFEAKARRFMQHPSRKQLPIKSIFYEVAGDKLLKIGADRKTAADDKAKNSQTGGGSNRAEEGEKSDWDLPKDEFEAKQERIRRGQKS